MATPVIPTFKNWTEEQIRADNERVERVPVQGETPLPPPRTAPEVVVASLRNRLRAYKITPAPDEPVMVEEPKPECPVCGGKGKIKYSVPLGHPLFGQLQKCPAPDCPGVRHLEHQRQMSYQEVERRHFGTTIEYLNHASMADYDAKDRRRAVVAAQIFLRDGAVSWENTIKRSLVFFGRAGLGKTHLMSAMRNAIDGHGEASQFRKVRTMLKAVQRGYSDDAELRDYQVENLLCTTPYLFIDELETLHSGDRSDIFEAIIDHRCRENLPTIIATNLAQDEIRDVWNDRVQSRLVHMAWWIEMAGASRRDSSGIFRDK